VIIPSPTSPLASTPSSMPTVASAGAPAVHARAFGRGSLGRLVAIVLAAGSTLSSAWAADAKTLAEAREQLKDYVHYVRIARYDLANSFGQGVLDKMGAPFGKVEGEQAMSVAEFAKLVDESGEVARFEESAARGQRIAAIEKVSAQLNRAYELGKQSTARNPAQIDASIALLTGTQRQRLVARERLVEAGEYAVPQLLAALGNPSDPALRAEVRQLLVDMGRQSARPLQLALINLDSSAQESVAGILGDIPLTASVPFLAEAAAASKNEGVKRAAAVAIAKLTGSKAGGEVALAPQFSAVARQYLAEVSSLTPFANESVQPIWVFDPATGLTGTAINSAVFHETMAMLVAQRALRADPTSKDALAVWIQADFAREIQSPAGYEHPLFKDRPEGAYYASAAGAEVLQSVLAQALATGDTQLARKAIDALSRTVGPASMSRSGANPALVAALRYPNRRVQTDAALALASAAGLASFEGSERVVPILAATVREAGVRSAVVVSGDTERANALAGMLRGQGFVVLAPAASAAEAEASAASATGVDLVVVALGPAAAQEAVSALRSSRAFTSSPVLVYSDAEGVFELGRAFGRDRMVAVVRSGIDPAASQEAIKQLTTTALGAPLTADEASAYQTRALAALRDVAIAGSPAMSVADATGPLVAVLNDPKVPNKAGVAGVLALINDKRAQQALVDAALKAEGDGITLLLGAAAESGKRFGNLLESRQIKALADLAANPAAPGATAASTLLGVLDAGGDRVVPMILK